MSINTLLWITACILIADFLTGFFHWFEDSYVTPETLYLPKIIGLTNIEHHRDPTALTRNGFIKRNSVPMAMSTIFLLISWLGGFVNWQIILIAILSGLGNEVHEWNHRPRPKNALVAFIMDCGMVQSRKQHSLHHRKPYDQYYCTLTNFTNAVLERIQFWRALEWVFAIFLRMPVKRLSLEREGY